MLGMESKDKQRISQTLQGWQPGTASWVEHDQSGSAGGFVEKLRGGIWIGSWGLDISTETILNGIGHGQGGRTRSWTKYLGNRKRRKQSSPYAGWRKEVNIRNRWNLKLKRTRKTNKTKSCLFEEINTHDWLVAQWIRGKREKTQITTARRGPGELITDSTWIKTLLSEYHESLNEWFQNYYCAKTAFIMPVTSTAGLWHMKMIL